MRTLLQPSLARTSADPIPVATMRTFLGVRYGSASNFKNTAARAVDDGPGGRPAVAVAQHLRAGVFGMPGATGGTGIALSTALPEAPRYAASIAYDVRFVGSGRFPLGGKLPGLGGVLPGHGSPPTGGRPARTGWSSRLMWRRNHDDQETARIVGYVYDPDEAADAIGQDRETGAVVGWGEWAHVEQHHQMNSIYAEGVRAKADGLHRIDVDGHTFENDAQVYRYWYAAKITHLLWSVFAGGNEPMFAPDADFDVEVANLRIWVP